MRSLISQVQLEIGEALVSALGDDGRGVDPLVKPATDPKFGDYQCNVAMSLGKALGRKPRDVAQAIADALAASQLFESVEVAGPGFINLRLRTGETAVPNSASTPGPEETAVPDETPTPTPDSG